MAELTIADYEEVLADKRRLTRELDVALNGKSAAKQASLCDLIADAARLRIQLTAERAKAAAMGAALREVVGHHKVVCALPMPKRIAARTQAALTTSGAALAAAIEAVLAPQLDGTDAGLIRAGLSIEALRAAWSATKDRAP